jgi:gamma-glutamyl-gamma-aminobutyrate hydrolase PuuD
MQCQSGSVWDEPVTMMHKAYTGAVARGGGAAVMFTLCTVGKVEPERPFAGVDALMLIVARDLDPAAYGDLAILGIRHGWRS